MTETPEQELARLRAAAAHRAAVARANLARAHQSDRIGRPRKLTEQQIRALRARRDGGESLASLAREVGVSATLLRTRIGPRPAAPRGET